ncbi:MAG TPA: hypothetical protein VK195_19800 [Burkholderiaceae bacterium]|nr:hypothetical protein [Burkholderiaceae bacterium]
MDYRSLLAVPLAALALTASGADTIRIPEDWMANASYAWPGGKTHEAGVAPETEISGRRALTVRALGEPQANDIGSISQYLQGYAGRRLRFTAQVKTEGVDVWGGLVVSSSYMPLPYLPGSPDYDRQPPLGATGCPEWCEVSVVADIANAASGTSLGVAHVGLALMGKGQVWARKLRVEAVGTDVPLSTEVFAPKAAEAMRAAIAQGTALRAAEKTAPKLTLR